MKILWTFLQLLFAISIMANPLTHYENFDVSHMKPFNEAAIAERLLEMDCLVTPTFDNKVESYLRSYLTYGYRGSEILLGKTALYFPIFEHYIQQHNLPEELKYLPIIESALRPYAVSTARAAGLWQFMTPTARMFGLNVNSYVDERRDPYKSTEAALKYLSNLFQEFGKWELALAAYNCGPGTVRKAIRYAGSKDFSKVSRFLPRETKNYIPRFIAASYMAKYYFLHGLRPAWPEFEQQWTRTMMVTKYTTFRDIQYVTGVNYKTLRDLNPGYKRGIIPTNRKGNFLVLPEMAIATFKKWYNKKHGYKNLAPALADNFYKGTYVVLVGDNIWRLAKTYHCSVNDIMRWNNLRTSVLHYRQELILYHKKDREFIWRA